MADIFDQVSSRGGDIFDQVSSPKSAGIPQRDPFSYSKAETDAMRQKFVQDEKQPTIKDEYVVKPAKSFAANTAAGLKMISLPVATVMDKITGGNEVDRLGGQIENLRAYSTAQAPAAETGRVGRFVRGVEEMVPDLVTGPVGLTNMLTKAATNRSADLVMAGVDPTTATKVGLAGLGATAAMTRLPLAGNTIPGTIVKGGAANVAAGQTATGIENAILGDEYKNQQIPMFDPEAMGEQFAMGAGFGLHQRAANRARGIEPSPTYAEKRAGKILRDQMPKEGSALESIMNKNMTHAQQLSDETGAKFTLDQMGNVNDVITGKRSLRSRSGAVRNRDQELQNENIATVRKLIAEAGGDEGNIVDVRNAIADNLDTLRGEISRLEIDLAEQKGIKDRRRQDLLQDLLDKQTKLQDAFDRSKSMVEQEIELAKAGRQANIDTALNLTNRIGENMQESAQPKEEIGRIAREKLDAVRQGIKGEADAKYDAVRQYSDVAVPDHSTLADAVNKVASEHPEDFSFLKDKADSVTRDILNRIAPEKGEQQFSPILDAQGNPVPVESAGSAPLTIGELNTLSSGIGAMRRAATATGKYDLARRLGIIKDGINSSLETVTDTGLQGKFAEANVHTPEAWSNLSDALQNNQFYSRNKNGKNFTTTSDFSAYMQENYPSAAGYPKEVVMGAVKKAADGNFMKMTDAERAVIDGINRDAAGYGATPAGVNLEASPLDLIKEANQFYREKYVPLFRADESPARKVLNKDKAGVEAVKDAEVVAKFLPNGDKGVYAGEVYKQVYGEDTSHAKQFADTDLLQKAFIDGEWKVSKARTWLENKSQALKKIGIYSDYEQVVKILEDAADVAKSIPLPTVAEMKSFEAMKKAGQELAGFKERVGKVSPGTIPDVADRDLPAGRTMAARKAQYDALERSPAGRMLNTDAESTIKTFVSKAGNNLQDAVKQLKDAIGADVTAQAGLKRAFADFLYNEWLSNSQKTADNSAKPMASNAEKSMDKYLPALRELYSPVELRKLENAKAIIETMARSERNVIGGSETASNLQKAAEAFSILKYIPLMPDLKIRIGTKAFSVIKGISDMGVDKILAKAYFDPGYAQKLIEVTKPKSPKIMARQLWNNFIRENMFVKDEDK